MTKEERRASAFAQYTRTVAAARTPKRDCCSIEGKFPRHRTIHPRLADAFLGHGCKSRLVDAYVCPIITWKNLFLCQRWENIFSEFPRFHKCFSCEFSWHVQYHHHHTWSLKKMFKVNYYYLQNEWRQNEMNSILFCEGNPVLCHIINSKLSFIPYNMKKVYNKINKRKNTTNLFRRSAINILKMLSIEKRW